MIYETNYAFDEEKKKYNKPINLIIGKIDVKDLVYKSKYIIKDSFYYPSYAKTTTELIANSKVAKVNNVKVHNQSYFYVLKAETTSSKPDTSKILNNETLYAKGTVYKTEFWNDPEVINFTE